MVLSSSKPIIFSVLFLGGLSGTGFAMSGLWETIDHQKYLEILKSDSSEIISESLLKENNKKTCKLEFKNKSLNKVKTFSVDCNIFSWTKWKDKENSDGIWIRVNYDNKIDESLKKLGLPKNISSQLLNSGQEWQQIREKDKKSFKCQKKTVMSLLNLGWDGNLEIQCLSNGNSHKNN